MDMTLLKRSVGYADLARQGYRLKRSTDDVVRDNARRHMVERMGKLRGLPQKIGQIISMGDDRERAAAFEPLADAAEPLPFEAVVPVIEEAWGRPIEQVVREMDETGLAASIGQVHRAVLLDGREVAVKVQYPGIAEAVRSDLKALGWLSVPAGDLRRGFDLGAYRAEIARDLDEELDYLAEADNQERLRALLEPLGGWIVPGVIRSLSTRNVLVTEWRSGATVGEAASFAKSDRDILGRTLMSGFLHTIFRQGFFHADPHPGNYRFVVNQDGPKVVLYDFGSVCAISLEHRLAILILIEMTRGGQGDPFKAFSYLGFDSSLLEPLKPKLAAVARVLFEPFGQLGKFETSTWRLGERMDDVLGDDRWNFRIAGPAGLIFALRAFRGLTFYLDRLSTTVSWYAGVNPILAEQAAGLARLDVSEDEPVAGMLGAMAKHLRIRVTEQGRTKVSLTFPASAVERLDELMDDDLTKRLTERSIDLPAIVRETRSRAYAPQTLFALDETTKAKAVQVWLE